MSRRSSIDENSIVPVNDHVEKVFEAGPDANGRSGWVTVTNRENYTFAYTDRICDFNWQRKRKMDKRDRLSKFFILYDTKEIHDIAYT